jgi:hypothetical protein
MTCENRRNHGRAAVPVATADNANGSPSGFLRPTSIPGVFFSASAKFLPILAAVMIGVNNLPAELLDAGGGLGRWHGPRRVHRNKGH